MVNQFGQGCSASSSRLIQKKLGDELPEISADWAAQRIKGLSLWSAAQACPVPQPKRRIVPEVVKTLIDTFRYPRQGPGMMWERCATRFAKWAAKVLLGRRSQVAASTRIPAVDGESLRNAAAKSRHMARAHHLVDADSRIGGTASAAASAKRGASGRRPRYRDFLTVGLILKRQRRFSDNWIYIHDSSVQVGRVQNYKSWSPEMVPDPVLLLWAGIFLLRWRRAVGFHRRRS